VLEGINVTTLWAIPCTLLGVSIPFVNHLDNQMAVQTHRWFAVDILILKSFPHEIPLL